MGAKKLEMPGQAASLLTGMPEIGWFCGYTPVEVIYAAGFLPVRITGHAGSITKADSCLHANMCQYVRSALDAALNGSYDRLRGVVFINSCDAMRRLYDVWRMHVDMEFTFLLDLPRGQTAADVTYYRNEIQKLRDALNAHFSVEITDGQIKAASDLYSGARDAYTALNELRRENPPRLSGREAAVMADLFCSSSPAEWEAKTRALALSKRKQPAPAGNPLRIVLDGSPAHRPEIIGFIEDCGFDVVAENLCSGMRLFDLKTGKNEDLAEGLAAAYLAKPPCARMMRRNDRAARVIELVRDYNAQGVIHISLKFCDTYLYDVPGLRERLTSAGIKSLFMESDGTLGSLGQLKTRLEAFAEVIEGSA